MNRPVELLHELRDRGFQLIPLGEKLRVIPADELTPALRDAIRANKWELLELLATDDNPAVQRAHATLAATRQPAQELWDEAEANRLVAELERLAYWNWPPEKLEREMRPICEARGEDADAVFQRAIKTCFDILADDMAAKDMSRL